MTYARFLELRIISQDRSFLVTHVHGISLDMDRCTVVEQREMTEIEMLEIVGVGIQGV